MSRTLLLFSLLALAPAALAQGPIPYANAASWESYKSGVSTGGAFADINGDGALDMVVANGNDISRQKLDVFYNDGFGNFPNNPSWSSADRDYHGQLSVGDVDGDGWPDVAVSVFLGSNGFGDKGHVKLYRNLGGALESNPSWRSADEFFSFSCDFGDADGDGDLDLAVATGEPYYDPPDKNRIYYNTGGALATTPGWLSAANDHALDVCFGDADGDGDLDLAFATSLGPTRVFFQTAGSIETSASFTATDNNNQNGNTCAWADVDADGFLELAVSDNDQLSGGSGDFKIYDNIGGSLQSVPFWSDFGGYVSSLAFADLHRDGYPDLAGGLWWGGAWIYANNAGSFPSNKNWESSKNSVSENIFFGDLDGVALRTDTFALASNGGRSYRLPESWLHAIESVRVDGALLASSEYCYDLEDGRVSLDRTPSIGVEIEATWSDELDMGMTNWDSSVGNQTWLRQPLVGVTATPTGSTSLNPGDTLSLRADFTSTGATTQSFFVAVVGFPPAGAYRILDQHSANLAAFGSNSRNYSFGVPTNVPPAFRGNWQLTVALFRGTVSPATISAEDSFGFTIL